MKKTFTLIELLVVVAIIAILVSILMPSLQRAREKARNAVCKTNVKQLATATTLYADDNDGFFPLFRPSGFNDEPGRIWWGRKGIQSGYEYDVTDRPVNYYFDATTDGQEVYLAKCPSQSFDLAMNNYRSKGTSYFANSYTNSNKTNHWNNLEFKSINQISISNKVVLASADGAYGVAQGGDEKWWRPWHVKGKYSYPYSFVDTSAKFYTPAKNEGLDFANGEIIFNLDFDE